MKSLILILPLLAIAAPASALQKYNSLSMRCDRAHAIIQQQGAAILSHPGKVRRDIQVYNTYVSSRRFCRPNEQTQRVSVPTADMARCPVLICVPKDRIRRDPPDRDKQPDPQ